MKFQEVVKKDIRTGIETLNTQKPTTVNFVLFYFVLYFRYRSTQEEQVALGDEKETRQEEEKRI